MKLIHYGSNDFDYTKYYSIKNSEVSFLNKPRGGLWTCPIKSKHSWRQWCMSNGFSLQRLERAFTLEISTDKIFIVNSKKDFMNLPTVNIINEQFNFLNKTKSVDFEYLSKDFYALHLTASGEYKTRYLDMPHGNFYGWDCETILILNPKCIITVNDKKFKWKI